MTSCTERRFSSQSLASSDRYGGTQFASNTHYSDLLHTPNLPSTDGEAGAKRHAYSICFHGVAPLKSKGVTGWGIDEGKGREIPYRLLTVE